MTSSPDASGIPAVILAAGLGSRLTGRTDEPKCLTPVMGQPLVGWIIEALAAAGVKTVYMVLGSGAQAVEEAVQRIKSQATIRTTRCSDWQLGNGRSAAHAETVLGVPERFLLLMSDHFITAAHVSAVLGVQESSDRCVLATSPAGDRHDVDTDDATKVLVEPDGRIAQIGKALDHYNGIDTGVFCMTRSLFPALARATAEGDHSLTGGNRVLASKGLLFARSIGNLPWRDVDTPADLRAAERLAQQAMTRSTPVK